MLIERVSEGAEGQCQPMWTFFKSYQIRQFEVLTSRAPINQNAGASAGPNRQDSGGTRGCREVAMVENNMGAEGAMRAESDSRRSCMKILKVLRGCKVASDVEQLASLVDVVWEAVIEMDWLDNIKEWK